MQSLLENKWCTIFVLIAILVVAFVSPPENYEGTTGVFNPLAIPLALGIFISVILLDLAYDRITYTYLKDDVRVHKRTGQMQRHIDVVVGPGAHAKGWVNLKNRGEDE